MDKYDVRMSNRALEDLDGIYTYIFETLLEPGIALKLVDKIESGIQVLKKCLSAVRSEGSEFMLIKVIDNCL